MRTREEVKAELADIDRQISEATSWGAWLGAIAERRRGVERELRAIEKQETID